MLIAAHRGEHPSHAKAHARLRALSEGHDAWAMPVYCLAEFIRVVTHPRVFTPPTDLAVGLDFLEKLLASPTMRLLLPGESHWRCFRQASEQADARGNLAFDAQIAAVCAESGVGVLLTEDRDFSRFTGLSLVRL